MLFSLAVRKYDRMAGRQGKEYSFLFVRADGEQLRKITHIVEEKHVMPPVNSRAFGIDDINEALRAVAEGRTDGKAVVVF